MNLAVDLTGTTVERNGQRVVQDVDLTVAPGSWFGLIGANGSGKTSLLRALAGRLPFTGGSCRIGGEDLVDDRAARALRFGFSPPADKLPDALRGRDVLELVSGSIDDVRPRLGKLHEALGLAPLLDRWIGDCSAGMRQRIAIAAAFASGHSHVILDEPFNWLDPVAIFDLREVLRARVDGGLTLITALHDLGTLARRPHARRWQGRTGAGRRHAAGSRPEPPGIRAADDRPPAIGFSSAERLAYAQKEILR